MPRLLFLFLVTFCLRFVCLSQSIYILSFIFTLSISHRYLWMNRAKLQDGSQPLSLANHPLYLHITCFHLHPHFLCFCLLFFYFISFFRILLVTVCTEKGRWRDGERRGRGIILSFNWFQTFSHLGRPASYTVVARIRTLMLNPLNFTVIGQAMSSR